MPDLFAVLYSDKSSRPNIAVNVLAGLEVLKSGFGWSDAELYDAFSYNLQVRYSLGYRNLEAGHFELRTLYNFRQALAVHMQAPGENLIEKVFEQVTDEQLAALAVKTGRQRLDSTPIASNIRAMSRLQLLVEVLQRVERMMTAADRQHYADDFAAYLKGSLGQYVYHIKGEETGTHLQRIGAFMQRLVAELADDYAAERVYRVLARVFKEHFVVAANAVRPKKGKELSASSLQSPDDWEATYRQKRCQDQIGYVANVTETCDPENDLQLIIKVQVAPNNSAAAALLAEALPDLKARTDLKEMNTDGAYNSPEVDVLAHGLRFEHIQTAIRGRQPASDKLNLQDFEWQSAAQGQPQTVTCPDKQAVAVHPGRRPDRFLAYFSDCDPCPFLDQCPTRPLKHNPERVLRFSQHDVDLALRRQRSAQVHVSGQNLAPPSKPPCAPPSTAQSRADCIVKRTGSVSSCPSMGKLPVRGTQRVSAITIASAVMANVRRIWRYKRAQAEADAEKSQQKEQETTPIPSFALSFRHWVHAFIRSLRFSCVQAPSFLRVFSGESSNSSSYRVSELASALNRPGRFVGTHFWNPPYLIPLLEVVEGKDTTPATVTALREVLHAVGKYPVHVQKDIAGFVGNRLQHALRREAIALLDSGVASAEDNDACARLGFVLRLPVVGPLAIADLRGLDLSLSIQEYLLPHLDRSTKPTATLRRLAGEGNLGAKSGRGFFEWNDRDHQAVIELRDSWIINALELIQKLKKNPDSSTT